MSVLQDLNVLHRDLKFENILIKNECIKIADFGLAKFMGDQLQVQSRRCGTPYTMAPQILFCKHRKPSYTIKSDMWSIGVILHEMLYQQHPFNKDAQNIRKMNRYPIKRKYGVLDQLIDGCLCYQETSRVSWGQFMDIYRVYLNKKEEFRRQLQMEGKITDMSFKKEQQTVKKVNNKIP